MAITINFEPNADSIVSTLVPIHFKCTEMTANTTNLIARCYYIIGVTEYQVGGDYRLAPTLAYPDLFNFDASEIFNTITKYTLNDMPNSLKLGSNTAAWSDTLQEWENVSGYKVLVKFYREYLDAATGLIVVDWGSPEVSNSFYVHEGCPETAWLDAHVSSNGLSGGVFDSFQLNWISGTNSMKRWLTNYPIHFSDGNRIDSQVTIHETESYMLAWFSPDNSPYCGYSMVITTYDATGVLNTHTDTTVVDTPFMQTMFVGFRDIVSGLTANVAEGTDFINVTYYYVKMIVGTTTGGGCVQETNATRYIFIVDRSCLPKGYMRFCFKNMLGGYDMVSSKGSFIKRKRSRFVDFEQSLGYDQWYIPMAFGKSNWSNENATRYSIVTHNLKKEYAEHWAELLQSTQVYMRVDNDSNQKVHNTTFDTNQERQPYFYKPIQIDSGSSQIIKSTDNTYQFKFNFIVSVPQRTPRY